MSGGLESSETLAWAASLAWTAALFVPLLLALYGFAKKPRDNRLFSIGVLMTGVVAFAWFVNARQQASRDREVQDLQKEIERSQPELDQRGFDPDARTRLVEQLGKIHGPSVFVLANAPDDEETSQFAREIGAVLKEAGWAVPASFSITSTPVVLPGEHTVATGVILGTTNEVPRSISEAVFTALRDSGMDVRIGPHWPGTEHPISILVGPKGRDEHR